MHLAQLMVRRQFGPRSCSMKHPFPAAVILAVAVFSGCVSTARLYNLDSGEVLAARFKNYGTGHGEITVTLPDGKELKGEYSTLDNSSSSFGTNVTSGSYGWATSQGFSFSVPHTQYGSAVVAGSGFVIDVVYQVDILSHGFGVAKDNKGGHYRLQF
jgi:hypothetical protein